MSGERSVTGDRSPISFTHLLPLTAHLWLHRVVKERTQDRILCLIESTEWDSNPRCRITNAESWPLDDRCRKKLRVES